jgi:valyl-tRNA synthetase
MPSGEYDPEAVEAAWQDRWVEEGTYAYAFDDVDAASVDPDTLYSIDTPPPTVSGHLHMGHLYQFTLQDFVARFHRMYDDAVYFPFGFDDNGIASERLTEDELGIQHQDYERREFQELCREVCTDYEAEFRDNVQSLAISVDWDNTYQTIEPRVQRISQLSFLDLYEKGREYRERAPTIWCPECETAISQVETEDAEQDSHFQDIAFEVADPESAGRESFVISTTRPELLPACVAVFVHPDDESNADLVGEEAVVPLFGQHVPILEDERVDMETGSGVVMCCTFGDQTDIEWYQAHDLPLRIAIDESGTMTEEAGEYAGLSSGAAREEIVDALDETGALLDRRPITHTVNVHERCGTGIEFLVTEQWYVKLLDKKDEYLQAGREMDWFPEKMYTRYKHWIEGLQWDWAISRQRSSGIPFPVWYCSDCNEVILADPADLPVDPLSDDPPVDACPACGHDEFDPEDDVFDTWATSSLTPLINAGWDWHPTPTAGEADADAATDGGAATTDADVDPGGGPAGDATGPLAGGEFRMAKPELYRFDMRPQGHDIISFWLFHTVVKCLEHTGEVPFDSVMINGMVLDENREKMSKSVGNVVEPEAVLEEFPVDAARYWAAGSAVGDDLPYKAKGLRAGEKLIRKLWNASKLVEQLTPDAPVTVDHDDLRALDRWLLARLDEETETLSDLFVDREFSKARDRLRGFFWHTFCDDYLEVAKQRIRDGTETVTVGGDEDEDGDGDPVDVGDASAAYTLRVAHRRFCKLFAPILAHVTEELWRDMHGDESVHLADWPTPLGLEADVAAGETALAVVSALRRYKSERQLSLTAPLGTVEVYGDVSGFESDISQVMHVEELVVAAGDPAVEEVVTGVDLDYSVVGPAYGSQVPDIEADVEAGTYELDRDAGVLRAGGVELDADAFDVEAERQYTGDGEMITAGGTVVVLKDR